MTGHEHDPDQTELLGARVAAPSAEHGLAPGTPLGRYRIEALLGRGGMGEVYRAEQLEPVRRTVAIKLLRAQKLDARHVAYFEIERQVLAQMRHPAIAQIFDADTTSDGHPFFAMEYIEGSPITQYCADHGLPLARRIELFVQVCEGVQHAHQKGVIHRDLKPGNLLVGDVDGRPHPKVIDFGIATASSLANAREVAGTPDYMSPEQTTGDHALVDTRSDVYSLGVVLCELLTGRRPSVVGETVTDDSRTLRLPSEQLATLPPGEAVRLAHSQGQSLAGMQQVLRGELDWVVAKAMQHDRGNRYPSVAVLADDLRRFLDGRAVQAVPPSRAYALRKFAGRNRGALVAASLVVAALLGGLAMSLHGLQQARAQRAIAEQRSAELEKVAAFQQSMLEGIDIEAMGLDLANGMRMQMARAGEERERALEMALASISTADLARTTIDRNLLIGAEAAVERDFSGQPKLASDLREAIAQVRAALGMYETAAIGFGVVADARANAAGRVDPQALRARQQQISALMRAGQREQAQALLDEAMPLSEALPATDPLRAMLVLDAAEAMAAAGEFQGALALLQPLHRTMQQALGEHDPLTLRVLNNLAIQYARTGDTETAVATQERLLALLLESLGEEDEATMRALGNLAAFQADAGNLERSIDLNRRLAGINTRKRGQDHPVTLSNRANLVSDLLESQRLEEAEPELVAVLEARRRVLGVEHPQTLRSELQLASLYERQGRSEAAMVQYRRVIEARTRLLGVGHPDTLSAQYRYARLLESEGRQGESHALLEMMLPLALKTFGQAHSRTRQIAEALEATASRR